MNSSDPLRELKPCPFCGGTNIEYLHQRPHSLSNQHAHWHVCQADGCGAETDASETHEGAVKMWNRRATLTTIPSATEHAQMNVTEEMLTRFLSWKLPSDFMPDAGITFKRVYNESSPYGPSVHEPTGTNLLTADQARAMLEHVLSSRATEPDRNAARYLWLRENWFTMAAKYPGRVEFSLGHERWAPIPESDLDAAIDAAIATRTATKD